VSQAFPWQGRRAARDADPLSILIVVALRAVRNDSTRTRTRISRWRVPWQTRLTDDL